MKGSDGSIWAFGDAATIEQPRALQRADELFEQADVDKVRYSSRRHEHHQQHARRPSWHAVSNDAPPVCS